MKCWRTAGSWDMSGSQRSQAYNHLISFSKAVPERVLAGLETCGSAIGFMCRCYRLAARQTTTYNQLA